MSETGGVVISKRLVIVNTASSLVTRLLSISVLIWLQQYLLKRISPEEYSLLPLVFSVMMFVPLFVFILTSGLKRYVLEAYAGNDTERISQIVSTMMPLLCASGVCIFVAGVGLAWHIEWLFRIAPEYIDEARAMLVLLMFSAAIQLPLEGFGSGLFVRQRFVLQNVIELGAEIFRLVLLLYLLLGVSVSVVWVVVASVTADLAKFSVITWFSKRLVPAQQFFRSRIRWFIARELINFGSWSSLDGFAGMIRKVANVIILNRHATPLDVTCYHLGALVPNRLEVLINNSFGSAVAPVVIGMHTLKQNERLKGIYLRLGRLALWGLLLFIAPLLVHYERIVRLYIGDTFLAAGQVMFLLVACYPLVYGNILHVLLASAKLRMRPLALRNTVASTANLALALLLVVYYEMGAVGAALATFVTYGLGSVVLLWPLGKQLAQATWAEVWHDILYPGLLPFAVSIVVMGSLVWLFPANTWTALAVNSMLGGCAYVTAVWLMMKDIDKRQFREILKYFFERSGDDRVV